METSNLMEETAIDLAVDLGVDSEPNAFNGYDYRLPAITVRLAQEDIILIELGIYLLTPEGVLLSEARLSGLPACLAAAKVAQAILPAYAFPTPAQQRLEASITRGQHAYKVAQAEGLVP